MVTVINSQLQGGLSVDKATLETDMHSLVRHVFCTWLGFMFGGGMVLSWGRASALPEVTSLPRSPLQFITCLPTLTALDRDNKYKGVVSAIKGWREGGRKERCFCFVTVDCSKGQDKIAIRMEALDRKWKG